jgi:hypothetical protein
MCLPFIYWNSGTVLLLLLFFGRSSSSSSVFKAFRLFKILFQNLFQAVPRWNRKLWHGIWVFVAGH